MKRIQFSNTIHIAASPNAVLTHVATIANQVGLQPLVVAVQEISRGHNAQGQPTTDFYSVELIRLVKVLPFRNRIRVQMTVAEDVGQIHFQVKSFPRVSLWSEVQFVEEGGGTAVTETITITTPNLVAGFVERTAVTAHKTLLQNLQARLEQ